MMKTTLMMKMRMMKMMMLCALTGHLLDSKSFAVTQGEAVVGQCAQNDGRINQILLKEEQTNVQTLEPHQHSILWSTGQNSRTSGNESPSLTDVQRTISSSKGYLDK